MPYVKKRRYSKVRSAYSRRRRPARKSRRYNRSLAVRKTRPTWKNPLPLSGLYKFIFSDSAYTLHPAAALYQASAIFSGNDIFDADVSGIGTIPYGYGDYFSASGPFQRYQVYASKITIYASVAPADTEAEMRNIRMCVMPCIDQTPNYTDYNDLMRTPGTRGCVIRSQDSRMVFSAYWTTHRAFPMMSKNLEYSTSAMYNADPTNRWYWHVYVDTTNTSSDVTVTYDVKIQYYVKGIRDGPTNEG